MRIPFNHSSWVIWVVAIVSLSVFLSFAHWDTQSIIKSDAKGYSAYLASWFIYQDARFDFYETLDWDEAQRYWVNKHPNGERFPKYTMGIAMLQVPAYLTAHVLAPVFGFESDGWSVPYHVAIGLNGIMMLIIGLIFTRKWLLRYYERRVVDWSILILFFSTNLFFQGVLDTAMAHIYSFAMVAGMLYGYDQWRFTKQAGWLFAAAAFFGFAVVIRPSNGLVILIPVISFFANRDYKFIKPIQLLLAAIIAFIPLLPQLAHWHYMTGDWFYYSYEDEKIFWLNSHWIEGLISWRNGWLIYTPAVIVAILGLIIAIRKYKVMSTAVLAMLLVNTYVVFAWWCWYYGNSFSMRPMVDFYPALAFGFAAAVSWTWRGSTLAKSLLIGFIGLATIHNLILTKHYHNQILSGSAMTKRSFVEASFTWEPNRNMDLAGWFKHPDTDRLRLGLPERTLPDTIIEKTWKKTEVGEVSNANPYSKSFKVAATDFESTEDRIINVRSEFEGSDFDDADIFLVMSIDSEQRNHLYQTLNLRKVCDASLGHQTVNAYFEKPRDLPEDAKLKVFFWLSRGKGSIDVKHIAVRQLNCPWSEPLELIE